MKVFRQQADSEKCSKTQNSKYKHDFNIHKQQRKKRPLFNFNKLQFLLESTEYGTKRKKKKVNTVMDRSPTLNKKYKRGGSRGIRKVIGIESLKNSSSKLSIYPKKRPKKWRRASPTKPLPNNKHQNRILTHNYSNNSNNYDSRHYTNPKDLKYTD